MGLITLILIIVIVLAIIGLGAGAFFSGIMKGAQQIGSNPVVKNATGEVKQYIANATENAKNKLTK